MTSHNNADASTSDASNTNDRLAGSGKRRVKHQPYNSFRAFYDQENEGIVGVRSDTIAPVHGFIAYISDGESARHQNILFHYTTLKSFESIVESGDFWVSEARSMNDFAEIEQALDELYYCVCARDRNFVGESFKTLLRDVFLKDFEVYIFSLTHDPLSLSMYRAYSSPEGVCIGIPLEIFTEGLDGDWEAGQVMYQKKDHSAMLAPIAESIVQAAADCSREDLRSKLGDVRLRFQRIAPFIKNYGFHEEKEFRIVTTGQNLKKYDRSNARNDKSKIVKISYLDCLAQSWSSDLVFDTLFCSPGKGSMDKMSEINNILHGRKRKFRVIRDTGITAHL